MRMFKVSHDMYGPGFTTPQIEDIMQELVNEEEEYPGCFLPSEMDNFMARLMLLNVGKSQDIGYYTIQVVDMTMKELNALPEFQGW